MTDSTRKEKITWFKYRWLVGLLGLLLMAIGQAWITIDTLPDRPPLKLGVWLTEEIHLAVPGIDNALYGLPLLLIGGALLGLSMRGVPLLPPEREFSQPRPFAFRQLTKTWSWLLVGAGTYAILLLRLNVEAFQPFHAPLWLASLALFAVAIAVWDLRRGIELSPQVGRRDLLWIIGLLFGGLIIGAYRLQGLPDGLIGDEGNFWGIARDIAIGAFKPSVFAVGVYTFPVFSSILPAWFIRLFGVSLWGWRLSSVLTGLLTVPPLYLLMREMFNRKMAVASVIVLVASPYFISFSRLGYNNIQALFVTALALYWLYLGLHRKSGLYLYLAGCAAGLGFYVYFAARMAVVIALLFIFLAWIGHRLKFREAAQAFLLLLIGFALFVAPHILYGLHHDPQALGYKTFESVFFNAFNGLQFYSEEELYSVAPPFEINDNQLFYHPRIYLELLARGFIRTMLAFQRPWLISEHYIAFPLAGSIGALFYVIGLAGTFLTFKQPRSQLTLLWFFVNALALSALNTVPPRHTHMVALIPALAILTTIGMQAIAQTAAAMHRKLGGFRNSLFAFVIALVAIGGLYDYFIKMPPAYRPHPDQVVLWTGLEAKGESLYYIYTNPAEADYMPYMVTPFRETVIFEPVAAEDILSGARSLPADRPSVALFPPEAKDQLWAALQQHWGASFLHKTFYSTGYIPILAAGMNTPFVFERDKTLDVVLKDSYLRPSLLGLFAFLIAAGAATIFLPASWRLKFPAPLRRFIEWFNAPGQPEPQQRPLWGVEAPDREWEEIVYASAIMEEEPPPQLPDWATDETFPATPTGARQRFDIQAKTVKTEHGRDIYIKVFFPRSTFDDPANKSTLSLPPLRIPNASLLTASVLAAFIGQILVHNAFYIGGMLSYLGSMGGLLAWGFINRKWRNIFSRQLAFSQKAETIALALLFLVMFVTRFVDLSYRVYGLEADETKWTIQSWYSAILRIDHGEFGGIYREIPLEFWVRSIFLRLFGLNFISARIESAFGSLLSIIFLYFIVRMATASPSVALLSALLYGFSFIELNLSHQALHDTPTEAWMMGALLSLFLAIRSRSIWQLQLTGILLALGMLNYETFYPTPVLALIYLLGLAIYEIGARKESTRAWLKNLGIVTWPVTLIYIVYTHNYLNGAQSHHFAELVNTTGQTGLGGAIAFALRNAGYVLQTTFSRILWTDSLINWGGPLVNPLLLPFVVIGMVYTLWNIRRPYYAFILLWYLANIIPGPILLGTVWPRVMFTATAPLMIWGALGLWTSLAALRAWFQRLSARLTMLVLAALVLAILVNDYTIFSSKLFDSPERQKRRELADLTANAASNADLLLLPYLPFMGDSAQVETHVILMSIAGAKHNGMTAENNFQQLEFEQLLPALWEKKEAPGIAIVFDKSIELAKEEREKALQVVLACYPQTSLRASGRFFDVYELSPLALTQPTCYHPPAPEVVAPRDSGEVNAESPTHFAWNTNGIPSASFALTLERKLEDVFWLEAETDFSGNGWHTDAAFTDGFSGEGFLLDDWGAEPVTYTVEAPAEGPYRVWVRFYKREDNLQKNYLSVAGQTLEFAENGGSKNEWTWQDMGVFDLPAGPMTISLSRTYEGDQYAIFIDALVVTKDLDYIPNEDNVWQTALDTGEIPSSASEYTTPGLLAPGEYRWTVRIFDGDRLVDSFGQRGIQSPTATFLVPGIP
jgi:4-amino-4-deoxy-L-arabinose transferase-like glycosyltransferase